MCRGFESHQGYQLSGRKEKVKNHPEIHLKG